MIIAATAFVTLGVGKTYVKMFVMKNVLWILVVMIAVERSAALVFVFQLFRVV